MAASTIERAFELARAGEARNITALKERLKANKTAAKADAKREERERARAALQGDADPETEAN